MSDKSKLFAKKQIGDNVTIAKMINTTPSNVAQILRRPNAKRYQAVIEALGKIIASREKLINS